MIGFNTDKKEFENENLFSDWEISQSKTNDTLLKSFQKPTSPLDTNETSDKSWKNITSKIQMPVLQQIKNDSK